LSALHAQLKRLFSSVSEVGNPLLGVPHSCKWESLAALGVLEKTGGFQPPGMVDLGHSGYETATSCIMD
jgi:hypothetical protein